MSRIPTSLKKHLSGCVQCTEYCSRIRLVPKKGVIPRGFCYGSGRIKDKELVLIFPEPYRNDSKEQAKYKQAKRSGGWKQVAEEVDRVTREYFASGKAASGFHMRTMDLLKEIFGTSDEIFRCCYFTELTKCEKEDNRIPTGTRKKCLELYLKRELEIIKPKAVVLFGKTDLERFKTRIDEILGDSGRTVLVAHPSRASVCTWRLPGPDREQLVNKICCLLDRTRII